MRLFDPGGRRSLDEAVREALDTAAAGRSAACLVCGAALPPASEPGAECPACLSALESTD
jgi:hypothetical protein